MALDKKKIFTPLNILTAIFVVAVLLVLTWPAYNTLKKISIEDKYEKKIREIEAAALLWADEKSVSEPMLITVNKLITDGYIKPDNDSGDFLSPRTEENNLNCHTVYIEYNNGEHEVKYNEITDCDLMASEQLNVVLTAKTISGKTLKSGEKTSENVILMIESQSEIDKYIWYENGKIMNEASASEKILIEPTESIDKTYSVKVETNIGNAVLKFRVVIEK